MWFNFKCYHHYPPATLVTSLKKFAQPLNLHGKKCPRGGDFISEVVPAPSHHKIFFFKISAIVYSWFVGLFIMHKFIIKVLKTFKNGKYNNVMYHIIQHNPGISPNKSCKFLSRPHAHHFEFRISCTLHE